MKINKQINIFLLALILIFSLKTIDTYAATVSVRVNNLNVSKQSAKVGEVVKISSSATGSKNPQYKFSIYDGTRWYVLQNYSSKSSTTWKPYRASTSKIKVEVKDKYSSKNYNSKQINYQVYSNVKIQSLRTDVNGMQVLDTGVKQTRLVNGSIKLTTTTNLSSGILYKYSVFDGQAWAVIRDYTYDKSYIWKPTKATTYKIHVDVKEANSLRYPDTSADMSINIVDKPQIQQISSNVLSPRRIGNTIVFNSTSMFGISPLYRYWVNDGTTWTMVKDYSSDASYSWIPAKEGNYKIKVDVKDKSSLNDVDNSKEMSFEILKYGLINYVDTNLTMNGFLDSQMKLSSKPQTWGTVSWINATRDQVQSYLNPNNFITDNGINQFLKLNYVDGISVEDLNNVLVGKGVLEGKGASFLEAGKLYNVNPVYLVAHSLLETGNGTSKLATGILVSSVHERFGYSTSKLITLDKPLTVYNVYGVGAYDANPNLWGSEKAYNEGWTTVDKAIVGGAKFISKDYINNLTLKQDTLYKMRWDINTFYRSPSSIYGHQYATDIGWAYKQSYIMKNIISKMSNSMFSYEIPKFN